MKRLVPMMALCVGCNLFQPTTVFPEASDAAAEAGTDLLDVSADMSTESPDLSAGRDMTLDPAGDVGPDFGADVPPDTGSDDWWDDAWSSRVAVTFDITSIQTSASDVPVPLRLGPQVTMLGSRDDLRIVDALGAAVPFEIASWGDDALVWVRASVDPTEPGPHLFVYVGNPAATTASAVDDVWADYLAVFHFEDELEQNALDPTWTALAVDSPAAADGLFGGGLDASAGSLYYNRTQNDLALLDVNAGDGRTFSACFAIEPSTTGQVVLWKEGSCIGWAVKFNQGGVPVLTMRTGTDCTDLDSYTAAGSSSYADNQWHCLTSRIDRAAGTLTISVDGQHIAAAAVDVVRNGSGTGHLRLGTNWNEVDGLNGRMDEAWIADGVRSDAWVEASHAALSSGFAAIEAVEQRD